MAPPIIVHLAGASGSGKTTYGRRLAARYPDVMVVEIDDYIQPEYPFVREMEAFGRDSVEYKTQWHEHMKNFFMRDIARATVEKKRGLVFVGLLDNMASPSDTVGFELFFACDKAFLDVPLETNLKQFYTRLVETIVWSDVASGGCGVPDSIEQINHVRNVTAQYKARGYRMLSPADMDSYFRRMFLF